jgi:hypothetical protein
MGLYRRRIVRFLLGIIVFIAIVQILSTLHFSSLSHGDIRAIPRKESRQIVEAQTGLPSVIQNSHSVKTSADFDWRKSKVSTVTHLWFVEYLTSIFYDSLVYIIY